MKPRLLFVDVLEERDPVFTTRGNGTVRDVEITGGRADQIRVLVQHDEGWAGNKIVELNRNKLDLFSEILGLDVSDNDMNVNIKKNHLTDQ